MFRGDRDGQALAFAELGRLALEGQGDDRPVGGATELDLADRAEEDEPLDGGREPVRAGGNDRAEGQRLGRIETVTGVPWSIGPDAARPIIRPKGVRTTTSPRESVPSTCPWRRLVGPSSRATKVSAGWL